MTTAPAPPRRAARAPSDELLAGAGVAPAVPLLEAGDAATGVQDPLLARVEGVAGGAGLDGQRAAGRRAAGGERVAATARHLGDVVVRVDVGLHAGTPSLWSRGLVVRTPPGAGRDPAAEAR